jgi:RNA polymerase sigma-70 factor (ECF subfamily)
MEDPRRWQELFDAHWHFIVRTVARLGGPTVDAEAAAQQVLLVVWRRHERFEGRSNLRTWLYGICLNTVAEHRRRHRRRERLRSLLRPFGVDSGPDAQLEARSALREVHALLDRLSEKRRRAFVLVEMEELEVSDVAQILGIPEATVRTRVFHARQELLRMMAGREP